MVLRRRRPTVFYVLYCSDLFGTERMAIETLRAVADDADTVLVAPAGPVHEAARSAGIETVELTGDAQLGRALLSRLSRAPRAAILTTTVTQSAIGAAAAACVPWVPTTEFHVVHGGSDAESSWARKRKLNRVPVKVAAVSGFVRDELVRYGVRPEKIVVLRNFLGDEDIASAQRRPEFSRDGVRNVAMIARLVPAKKLELVFQALDRDPALGDMTFTICGNGPLYDDLARRTTQHPNVRLAGFVPSIPAVLAQADLFLHLNHDEPFGLVVLEALAANVPALVPDGGGTLEITERTSAVGTFRSGDPDSLARALRDYRAMPASALAARAREGAALLEREFSASARKGELVELLLARSADSEQVALASGASLP